MTAHEVAGYVLGFALSLLLATIGYLVDGWRRPEDRVGWWVGFGSLYVGLVGMIVSLVTLLVAGLTA